MMSLLAKPAVILTVIIFIFWSFDFWKGINNLYIFHNGNGKEFSVKKLLRLMIFLLATAGWGFMCYSFTEPKKEIGYSKNKIDVNDIYFVVDVSRSMLAEDFEPNRLEAAKDKIKEFVSLRPTDRMGIVIFAEKVFTLLPLTTDFSLVGEVVNEINIGFLGNGTNIGDALGLAVARLISSITKTRLIILLTDGVSNVGTMTPLQAAEEAKKSGIKIYTIGIGGDEGARIPIQGNSNRYQNIPGGSIDFETLQKMSSMTGGKSFVAGDPKALKNVFNEIDKLERSEIEKTNIINYEELYYPYLLLGLVLFGIAELSRVYVLREVA